MPDPVFRRVAVVGAGTMGHAIAQLCALAGAEVRLFDTSGDALRRGLDRARSNLDKAVDKGKIAPADRDAALGRLAGVPDLAAAVGDADLVVESVPEDLALKRSTVARVAALSPAAVVIATNTSSLSVARIAEVARDPSRVLGAHFFNPAHVMALLELVRHPATDPAVLSAVRAFGEALGKTCIVVRDSPGFAASRLGIALGMEAARMVEEGVASPEDIDQAMVLGYRHPVGPLRLGDLVGWDVRVAVGDHLARELGNPAFEPPALVRRMVAEGRLGQKAGEGFYRW
jgi:3-hydroxybutyryl-CoA dehydrogenase